MMRAQFRAPTGQLDPGRQPPQQAGSGHHELLPRVEGIVAAVSDDEHVRLDEAQQRTSELAFAVVDRSQFGGDDRVGSAFSETDGVYLWEGAPCPPWYFPNSAKFAGESGTSICTASMAIRRHDRIHPRGAPGLAKGAAIRSYSSFTGCTPSRVRT